MANTTFNGPVRSENGFKVVSKKKPNKFIIISMKKKICIIDYGCGNTKSIENAIKFLDYKAVVSNKVEDIRKSTHLILPGVGSYSNAITKVKLNLNLKVIEQVTLTDKDLTKTNTLETGEQVKPVSAITATVSGTKVSITLPPASWQMVRLSLKQA